jgi:SAM-dependent methyltransferase
LLIEACLPASSQDFARNGSSLSSARGAIFFSGYDVGEMPADSWTSSQVSIAASVYRWWCEVAQREGILRATWRLLAALCEFCRDSTPARRRQRYGDAEFDWDHRVDTTSATVGWRNRLLGVFHSPYQPTEAALFHEMLDSLHELTLCDFRDFIFVDLGSGKGRAILMASDYPFRRVIGVEILPELHRLAEQNIGKYKNESQQCFAIQSICSDATDFVFPVEPTVLYLFNPFPEAGLQRTIENLEKSLGIHPRVAYVLYHNPVHDDVLREYGFLTKIGGTHQYAIYRTKPA